VGSPLSSVDAATVTLLFVLAADATPLANLVRGLAERAATDERNSTGENERRSPKT